MQRNLEEVLPSDYNHLEKEQISTNIRVIGKEQISTLLLVMVQSTENTGIRMAAP